MMNKRTTVAFVMLLLTSVWFGLQAWLTQTAIHASSALAFNTERSLVAAVVMGGICLFTKAKLTRRSVLGGFWIGMAYAFTIGLESQALAYGSAGRVAFLGSLFVAIMPFMAYFLRSEKLLPAAIIGSFIMVLGAGQLLYLQDGSSLGDCYALFRSLVCTVMIILVGRFADADWRVSSFITFCTITALSFAGSVMTDQAQFSLQPSVLLPVVASALIGSVGCMAAMNWAGRHLSSTVMGILFFLDSPFAVMWGVLLFKEALTGTSLLAYALIGVGALVALTAHHLPILQLRIPFVRTKSLNVSELV